MKNDYPAYLAARQGGYIPASVAINQLRYSKKRHEGLERLQFVWNSDETATWQQDGFDLVALVVDDNEGWWTTGADVYGHFSDTRQTGAVRHRHGNNRCYHWFIPTDIRYRHESYRRACDYAHTWHYVGVQVKAAKYGVVLADASLWGIESDCKIDHLTEIAIDLGNDVAISARLKLRELCGGICP